MRLAGFLLLIAGLATVAFCADQPSTLPVLPCAPSPTQAASCNPSKKELKQAKSAFEKGLKLQEAKHTEEAFNQFDDAARLAPQAVDYVTAREMARQQLVYDHLQLGNQYMLHDKQIEAQGEFSSALHLDPQNDFAQQRMRDALGEWAPKAPAIPRVLADAGEMRVSPNPVRADFHYRGDSRGLLTMVATAYGVTTVFDDSVLTRPVRFDITNVDFDTAMGAACDVTRTFWTPLADKQVMLAAESPENHRVLDRMSLRTFYVPGVSSPKDLADIANLMRSVFDVRFITQQPGAGVMVVRAPQATLDAVTKFMAGLGDSRPQVMLDVRVYQIDHTLTRDMGLQIPNNFQLFNIPIGALAALGGQNIQDLINQLISSGGINQGSSEALSGLLAQLQGQQNSIFSQPLATFGNGLTLMGLSLGTAGAQLSLNETWVKSLEHMSLRASQGAEASFKVGSRYPILNASFSPAFNTPQISQVIQNNTFQAPFPSFNYEDIGLTLKATPTVNLASDVSLNLELQFRSLTGQSSNGVPVISNREYKGSITLMDGEPAVVAGSISHSDQRSLSGIPGLGAVPGLNHIMTSNSKEEDDDELLLLITPHVISGGLQNQSSEVWMSK